MDRAPPKTDVLSVGPGSRPGCRPLARHQGSEEEQALAAIAVSDTSLNKHGGFPATLCVPPAVGTTAAGQDLG